MAATRAAFSFSGGFLLPGGARASRREFELLLEPVLDTLYATALRLTRSRPEAEDVVQESVMKAWRSFETFERGTNFRAWVLRIATNTFLSKRRFDSRRPKTAPLGDPEAVPSREDDGLRPGEDWEALYPTLVEDEMKRALDALGEDHRIAFLLSTLGGLSVNEIAAAVSAPPGTIMSRLFRARAQLRESLRRSAASRGTLHPRGGEGR